MTDVIMMIDKLVNHDSKKLGKIAEIIVDTDWFGTAPIIRDNRVWLEDRDVKNFFERLNDILENSDKPVSEKAEILLSRLDMKLPLTTGFLAKTMSFNPLPIDKLKRKNKPINFETVSKEAGVSRATLYNNAQVKERILSLRAISKASPLDDVVAIKKDKMQFKDEKIATLREQVKKLEDDKKKLIVQLVDYEELKSENERLKKQLAKR